VFLLDMGKPQRIADLAERFIRAHGLEPHADIPIRITGIRPGEKLFEELAYDGEDMLPTAHPAIRRWRTTPPTSAAMQQVLATFDRLRGRGDQPWRHTTPDAIVHALRAAVPEMIRSAA
jgi:FlaA1/EpsC-like NDP-sugar epimerase